jgi:hypothetical protein
MPMHQCAVCHLTDETRTVTGPRAPLPCACNAGLVQPVRVSAPATRRGANAFAALAETQDAYTVRVPLPVPARS